MLNLGSTQTGAILLGGLFVYDVFWVFGTPVMVTVARAVQGPIKLLFRRSGAGAGAEFGMLGLGDIVIPGAGRAEPRVEGCRLGTGEGGGAICWHCWHRTARLSHSPSPSNPSDLPLGIFLALMHQFDAHNGSGRAHFHAACAGYVAGLGATIAVMNAFQAAQPALLYIVPAVLGAVFATAAARGDLLRLWRYNHGDAAEEEKADSKKKAQ